MFAVHCYIITKIILWGRYHWYMGHLLWCSRTEQFISYYQILHLINLLHSSMLQGKAKSPNSCRFELWIHASYPFFLLCSPGTPRTIMGKVWLFHSSMQEREERENIWSPLFNTEWAATIMNVGALSTLCLELLEHLWGCEEEQTKALTWLEAQNISCGQLQSLVLSTSHLVS